MSGLVPLGVHDSTNVRLVHKGRPWAACPPSRRGLGFTQSPVLLACVLSLQDGQEKNANPVKAEEAKLKAKYPGLAQRPGGSSDFLMKRLHKGVGVRTPDSSRVKGPRFPPLTVSFSFSAQQKYFDSGDYNMAKAKMNNVQLPVAGPDKNLVTGDHIPTPQDLPQRKSSLVTSKLAG